MGSLASLRTVEANADESTTAEAGVATAVAGEVSPGKGAPARVRFRRLKAFHERLHANPLSGMITKVVVTAVGALVVLAGFVMIVTPGPGIVAIVLGLAILASEWPWAERLMHRVRDRARKAAQHARDLDPKVRRRRTILTVVAAVLFVGGVALYVVNFGWPGWVLGSWSWLQGHLSWIPDLP